MKTIKISLEKLRFYIESESFKGYDPYDTLNSWIPFLWLGKWGPILAIQFQKRNPINIRPLLGINKFHSTKGMGLLLSGYLKLYTISKDQNLIPSINFIKEWLLQNANYFHGNACWGYDYPYASIVGKVDKGFPTVIHHSYIIGALFEYYKIFKDEEIKQFIINSSSFVLNNIPKTKYDNGICFGYSPESSGCCYNASLHAAQCLAYVYCFTKEGEWFSLIKDAVDFVISMQKESGVWFYGFTDNPENERKQIDFHQGFILESIFDIKNLVGFTCQEWENSITNGLNFYMKEQFFPNGQSLWRLPIVYPVDIHNQSQGIITFSKLNSYSPSWLDFAKIIAEWTIDNMQSNKGCFFYRNYKHYKNKIPYMRWSQAWMALSLSEYMLIKQQM